MATPPRHTVHEVDGVTAIYLYYNVKKQQRRVMVLDTATKPIAERLCVELDSAVLYGIYLARIQMKRALGIDR